MKHKDVYISVDIEAAGSIPGEYSMLSLGACHIDERNRRFYVELRPITMNYDRGAMQVASQGLECIKDLRKRQAVYDPSHQAFQPQKVLQLLSTVGTEPGKAMHDFNDWVIKVAEDNQPVFVGFNATFDWSFVNWYLRKFTGDNPFGISGLDIKSYYMGKAGVTRWEETKKSKISRHLRPLGVHTHNALEDALEQAEIFSRIRNTHHIRH